MMSGNIDIAIDRDVLTKKLQFFIPNKQVFYADGDKDEKALLEAGYISCNKVESEGEQLEDLKKENLNNLFIDTIRLKNSAIYFNDKTAKDCIPDLTAKDEEKEAADCLVRFNHFLEQEFKHGKETLLRYYQQRLISFPGSVIFQALGKLGHTLKEKIFQSRIICCRENDFLPSFITRIEKLKYIPKGKDLFEQKNAIDIPGYLETRLHFFESDGRCGFNVEIMTDNSKILALLLGQFDNKKYLCFLDQCMLLKKKLYLLSDSVYQWINKQKNRNSVDSNIINSNFALNNSYTETTHDIERVFKRSAYLHGCLDILLAAQERLQFSPIKLKQDLLKLNQYCREIDNLSYYFRRQDIQIESLIEHRKQWISKPSEPTLTEVLRQMYIQQNEYFPVEFNYPIV